jgi:hypothetical protein
VKAKATKPEQSRKRPATVTARKLLEANSSPMVHHLSHALLEWKNCADAQSKSIPFRDAISIRTDVLMQHPGMPMFGASHHGPRDGKAEKPSPISKPAAAYPFQGHWRNWT